ncbi:MAG: PAS domain-containing protein [Campylobacterota bacterium]|nr:PAS domain-containing protein [Campylobacterota bacterium]
MPSHHLSKKDAPVRTTTSEKILGENDFIVSKTDMKGHITYCNRIFAEMAGYSKSELIGANHNLIRHPDMPAIAFKMAWDLIKNGKEFFGFVKNLCKDGGYYWVFAYITPDYDTQGNIVGFTSVRRKPSLQAIEAITPLYKQLVDAEREGNLNASKALLEQFLKDHNSSYDALVTSLQQH